MQKIITERGWAGHFIGSFSCGFRRNTLISTIQGKFVVSTIGNWRPLQNEPPQLVRIHSYYETLVFKAKNDGSYIEADVTQQVSINSKWHIDEMTDNVDNEANDMHENVVKEIINTYNN